MYWISCTIFLDVVETIGKESIIMKENTITIYSNQEIKS